uniref:LTD domain-containing protein n=1 Tax=Solibacter usitatus (strain Ellin6076) TaxID=234267 RepID=Q01TW4_SOLUE
MSKLFNSALLAVLGFALMFSSHAQAQCISLTASGTAYTQNFDTLANTGTSSTVPAGWAFGESGTNANTTYTAGTGSSNAGDTYSFGATGSTERALGTLLSGSLVPTIGACFVNNTGSPITSLAVAYTGEEWRLGTAARTDRLNFEYSLNATSVTAGTWVGVAALNFTTPDTATAGAKNGNAAADRTAISSTINSLNIANGATFWIHWTDFDASGADDGLAVDDFSLTPTAGTSNPSGTGSAAPNPVVLGSTTLLKVTVAPGANPTSTGLAVSADLTAIGGSASQAFFDDGTNGDAVAGDNVFSFSATIPANNATGAITLPATITDAQARSGTAFIPLTVNPLSTPPTGVGTANPNSLQANAPTLLTVAVASGANPVSTGITVTADLSAIGGSSPQTLYDDGTHGDVTPGDNLFSFQATVTNATTPGAKILTATIADAQLRSSTAPIALTVQSPPAPTSIKISQVYGGGGNSGSTYTNDFIELFNQSNSAVDISAWSVQQVSATATGTWGVTPLCTGTCLLQPGHYYLVQESKGANGTTPLPTPDVITVDANGIGGLALGAGSGKVALVNNTTPLTGACPASTAIADLVGYGGTGSGGPNCYENFGTGGTPAGALDNLTAAVRKGNGCIDTNINGSDFVTIGPIPRNSGAPVNICGGDATKPSGVGTASPSAVDAADQLLLQVAVTPATNPSFTAITSVIANLTSIGGSANQPFYDDGTHGDPIAGDNVFTFLTATNSDAATGAKYITTTITDALNHTAPAPITVTVASPTCGVERWSVKVGTDSDAGLVNLLNPVRSTVSALRLIPAPADPPGPPLNSRVAPTETTVWVVNGIVSLYKLETDEDYHIVLKDLAGNTMVTEIPSPACDGSTSPFDAAVAAVRAKFDSHFTATINFQSANVPVQMKGVGFFDFIHGQTGVAPNGIELHPILDIAFTTASTTTLTSSPNPALSGQSVTFTATVASVGGTATGTVSFYDGATLLGPGTLGPGGQATFTTNALAIGPHSITASYEGDSVIAQSVSTALTQNVQGTPVITWANPAPITYGSALVGQLNATADVPGTFAYTPPSGTVPPVGNGQILSVIFTPSSSNYAVASKSVTIDVLPASGGGSPANLVPTKTLARVDGQVVATITLANTGGTAAQNVILTVAKIGTVSGTPLPQSVGTIAAGASVQLTVTFPGTVGAAGTGSSLTLSGTATGATFGSTARITLP